MNIFKKYIQFVLLSLGLVLLYFNSFTARFFQDDFLLLDLAKKGDYFTPIQNFPYRPISIQVFYGVASLLFGKNVLGFHLLLFLFFLASLYFIYKIAELIFLKERLTPFCAVILYSFNISLFPLFYWIATSYFTLAAFFVFGGIFFYFKKGRFHYFLSWLFFVLGLLSNEVVLVYPLLILSIGMLINEINLKKIISFVFVDVLYLIFRVLYISPPLASDYKMDLSLRTISTFRWYFLRIFNLPEGVKISAGPGIYFLSAVLVFSISIRILIMIKNKTFPLKLGIFSLFWFLTGAFPFYFLPNHMSSYYLTLSLFGPLVLFSKVLSQNKLTLCLFFVSYVLLSFLGLEYLSKTHWIILKSTR